MATRKANEDVLARTQAEREIGDFLAEASGAVDIDRALQVARDTLSEFPVVEFETGVSRMPGGEKVAVRRLVITGPWVVDPNAPKPRAEPARAVESE